MDLRECDWLREEIDEFWKEEAERDAQNFAVAESTIVTK
jgi:hypothetical protein